MKHSTHCSLYFCPATLSHPWGPAKKSIPSWTLLWPLKFRFIILTMYFYTLITTIFKYYLKTLRVLFKCLDSCHYDKNIQLTKQHGVLWILVYESYNYYLDKMRCVSFPLKDKTNQILHRFIFERLLKELPKFT